MTAAELETMRQELRREIRHQYDVAIYHKQPEKAEEIHKDLCVVQDPAAQKVFESLWEKTWPRAGSLAAFKIAATPICMGVTFKDVIPTDDEVRMATIICKY